MWQLLRDQLERHAGKALGAGASAVADDQQAGTARPQRTASARAGDAAVMTSREEATP